MDVLNTKANPLLEVFNSVFGNVEACTPFKPQDYDTLTMDLLLAQYHNDLKQIEQALRGVFKSRSGLTKRMNKRYKDIWRVNEPQQISRKTFFKTLENYFNNVSILESYHFNLLEYS